MTFYTGILRNVIKVSCISNKLFSYLSLHIYVVFSNIAFFICSPSVLFSTSSLENLTFFRKRPRNLLTHYFSLPSVIDNGSSRSSSRSRAKVKHSHDQLLNTLFIFLCIHVWLENLKSKIILLETKEQNCVLICKITFNYKIKIIWLAESYWYFFHRVLQLCGEFKQGITYQIIQNDMPTLKLQQIVEIINKLLATVNIMCLATSSYLYNASIIV